MALYSYMMIRPFDLRDVSLVAHLESQGTALNAELALTQKPRPLPSALAVYLMLTPHGPRTYVCRGASPDRAEKLAGLAQLLPRRGTARGHITFMSPALAAGDGVDELWLNLLNYLCADAARQGLHHLIVEAPEDGEEVEVLRRAGFAIYVRQDIYRLDPARRPRAVAKTLRECQSIDTWAAHQLYYNTAPRLAHLAEGMPGSSPAGARGYVYYEKGELAAYVEVRRGSHGAWFSLIVHPDSEARAADIIAETLSGLGPIWDRPIFCGVRRYQEWLRRPLESLEFVGFGASALMVKHLAAPAVAPEPSPAHAQAIDARVEVTPT